MKRILLIATSLMTIACNDKKDNQVDSALANDLVSASQFDTISTVSAQEQQDIQMRALGYAPVATSKSLIKPTTTAPVRTRTIYRDRPVYRSSTSSRLSTPTRTTTTVKHTKRDAAIGAGTGAVIGAVTSRDKVKGAVIGGVVGGILGGVIGNNVDKTKR